MKKNTIKIIGTAILTFCMLTACSLPTVKLDTDRQSFREALTRTMALKNVTVDATALVLEKDTVIFSGDNYMEWDGKSAYMAGPVVVNGQTLDMEGVWDEGHAIFRIGDKYKSFEPTDSMMRDMSGYGPEMTDYIIAKMLKDMPGYLLDDSGNVTITMQEADIPADWNKKMNTMFSSMAEWSKKETLRDIFVAYFGEAALSEFPVTGNARLLNMLLTAKIDEGIVKNITLSLVIAGTDKAGAERVITLDCVASLSRIGTTIPATIDIEGQTVTPVTKEDYKALSRTLLKLGWRLI